MTKTGKRSGKWIAVAAAVTTLMGLGGAAYAAGSSSQQGGMPFMRGMMFWAMDRNDDGFVDRGEVDTFRARMFDKMDPDGDGKITKEEMKAHQESRRQGRRPGGYGQRGYGQRGYGMGMGMGMGMGGSQGAMAGGGRRGDGMMFWFLDRNEDGFVDRAEIDAFRTKRFEKMDKDGDGRFTADEMKARMEPRHQSRGGEGNNAPHRRMGGSAKHMFKQADANNDGAVTREEFLATEPRMFMRADADGDGKVSEAEMKEADRPRGERMFARADANNDGAVTREEFLATEPRMFMRADKDGDGKVSEAEAKELMGGKHRRHGGNDME